MIRAKMSRVGLVFLLPVVSLMLGCPTSIPTTPPDGGGGGGDGGGSTPDGFTNASAARGGALYDKWWAVIEQAAPTTDNALWATRPDMDTNTRTGADTWRCKECHGWDYKGVDGAYASGSHKTGIMGIFGTTLSAQEVFDKLADSTGHGYRDAGLEDADLWDLAKFVLEGLVDGDDVIDAATKKFTGDATAGEARYVTACSSCHGTDGRSIPPGAPADFSEGPGFLSNDNPWEFLHKVRFGAPGTIMTQQFGVLTLSEAGELGAFSQTLDPSLITVP